MFNMSIKLPFDNADAIKILHAPENNNLIGVIQFLNAYAKRQDSCFCGEYILRKLNDFLVIFPV